MMMQPAAVPVGFSAPTGMQTLQNLYRTGFKPGQSPVMSWHPVVDNFVQYTNASSPKIMFPPFANDISFLGDEPRIPKKPYHSRYDKEFSQSSSGKSLSPFGKMDIGAAKKFGWKVTVIPARQKVLMVAAIIIENVERMSIEDTEVAVTALVAADILERVAVSGRHSKRQSKLWHRV
jgi:hypothetical protein